MFKFIFLLILIYSNSNAMNFDIISITSDSAFNYFASLQIWLLIISSPMYLVISLLKYAKRSL